MESYTTYLADKALEAADDDYPKERILEAVKSFRTFDASLDGFIKDHGYKGDIEDVSEKTQFIKKAFENAGIFPLPRNMKKWYTEHKNIDRRTAFQICFAFGLDVSETDDFFRRVLLEKSFDCHVMEEAIYYFCIRNGKDYAKAQKIIEESPIKEVPDVTKSKIVFEPDVLFTTAIIRELDQFEDTKQLLSYFRKNVQKFGYNHTGATEAIQRLWRKIAGTGKTGELGLADLEKIKIQQAEEKKEERGVWEIFRQMLGLDERDEQQKPLYEIKADRSIKQLLRNNRLLPAVAEKDFPSRQTIEKILKGKHVEPESIRKILILFYFYWFWIGKIFKNQKREEKDMIARKNMTVYQAKSGDTQRCIAGINKQLLEVGYQELYLGNPYDWIFIYCCENEEPLIAFREFIHELYLENEAIIKP